MNASLKIDYRLRLAFFTAVSAISFGAAVASCGSITVGGADGGGQGGSHSGGTGGVQGGGGGGGKGGGGGGSAGAQGGGGTVGGTGGTVGGTGGAPGGTGGAGGAADCATIQKEFVAAMAEAKMCNTGSTVKTCQISTDDKLECPCPTFVNGPTDKLDALHKRWQDGACSKVVCTIACVRVTSGACVSTTGALAGACQDQFQ
jgi:hypothetical protein